MKELDCLFIGSSTRDMMMLADAPPESDARISASRFVMTFGGVSNIAAFAHQSLGGITGVITAVGGDDTAAAIREFQEKENLEYCNTLCFPDAASSTSMIVVEKNGKRMITHYGGCMDRVTWDMVDRTPFCNTRMIHLGVMAESLMMDMLKYVKSETDAIVSIDGGNFTRSLQEKILPYTDIFITDNKTVKKHNGMDELEGCRYYLDKGVRFACVTAAENGVWGASEKNEFHVSAISGDIVDTTGAGDNFHGAFLYCIGQGMSYPEAARFASCYATLSCAELGGPTADPKKSRVLEVMEGSRVTYIK